MNRMIQSLERVLITYIPNKLVVIFRYPIYPIYHCVCVMPLAKLDIVGCYIVLPIHFMFGSPTTYLFPYNIYNILDIYFV